MKDYIPRRENDFLLWVNSFNTWTQANGAANGLTPDHLAQLAILHTTYSSLIGSLAATQATLDSLQAQKRQLRGEFETFVRALRAIMNPNLADPERAAAGFTVPKRTLAPVRPPVGRPVGRIDASRPLAHTLRFADSDSPTRRGKPPGVRHVEIWLKIGDPRPADHTAMRFVGTASRPTFTQQFEGPDAGKTAHYLLRWINSRGQPGPWGEVHSATIGGV